MVPKKYSGMAVTPSSRAAQACVINAYVSYRIKRARLNQKLTTGDVAAALGIEQEVYERMEDAQSFISTSTMIHCAQVINTPVNSFLPPTSLTEFASTQNDMRAQKWGEIFKALEDCDEPLHHLSLSQLRDLIAKFSTDQTALNGLDDQLLPAVRLGFAEET